MHRSRLMVEYWLVIIEDAKVRSGFEPEVVWLTRMNPRRVIVRTRIRGHREERVIDIGCGGVTSDIRPVMILHQDHEHRGICARLGRDRIAPCGRWSG